jgi:hypothetical protein
MNIKQIIHEEIDDLSWMDNIKPKIDSCDDLNIGGKYVIDGRYCFPLAGVVATVIDIVGLDDGSGELRDHIVIDLGSHKEYHGYETHKAEGLCERDTCFYVSCKNLKEKDNQGNFVKFRMY